METDSCTNRCIAFEMGNGLREAEDCVLLSRGDAQA